jgi:hypothetical protein
MKNELVGTVNSTENIEVPQKVKNKTTLWSSNPTSGYKKEMKIVSESNICTLIFTVILFTITVIWNILSVLMNTNEKEHGNYEKQWIC